MQTDRPRDRDIRRKSETTKRVFRCSQRVSLCVWAQLDYKETAPCTTPNPKFIPESAQGCNIFL